MTAKKKTPTNPTLTISAKELGALVAPVIPHAERGSAFSTQILEAVLVRKAGEYVTALATDRYKIGFQRLAISDTVQADDGFRAAIPVVAIKHIRTVFRATKVHNPVLRLTVEGDQLHVEIADGFDTERGAITGASLRFALAGGEYPRVDHLVREALEAKPPAEAMAMNVNPNFLAEFRIGQPLHTPITITPTRHPNSPWLVRVGADFVGLIVPVRFAGEGEETSRKDEWLALLDPAEPKTKAAA
ncbi:hypothetical protein [Isoptericola sp. NPDC055881]